MTQTPLRRLIDLPGLDALEVKALMKPRVADPDALAELLRDPEIDVQMQFLENEAFKAKLPTLLRMPLVKLLTPMLSPSRPCWRWSDTTSTPSSSRGWAI